MKDNGADDEERWMVALVYSTAEGVGGILLNEDALI